MLIIPYDILYDTSASVGVLPFFTLHVCSLFIFHICLVGFGSYIAYYILSFQDFVHTLLVYNILLSNLTCMHYSFADNVLAISNVRCNTKDSPDFHTNCSIGDIDLL